MTRCSPPRHLQRSRTPLVAPAQSRRWRSARTARPWPPATLTAWPRCGTWPLASRSAAWQTVTILSFHNAPRGIFFGGVQPGRQDPGHRRHRGHGTAMEPGHPAADPQPDNRPRRNLFGHVEPEDGKTLATGGVDGTTLWSLATGRQIGPSFAGLGQVLSVAFSPDGKSLGRRRRRRHGTAVEPGHRPADPQPGHRLRWSLVGGIQPGRQDPGHRRRRRHGPVVERQLPRRCANTTVLTRWEVPWPRLNEYVADATPWPGLPERLRTALLTRPPRA